MDYGAGMARAGMGEERCVVCHRRITDSGWRPVCSEVCWDSMDAAEMRLRDELEQAAGDDGHLGGE